MDDGEDPGNVFAIPDLWGGSSLYSDVDEKLFLFAQLKLDIIDEKIPDYLQPILNDDGFFALPDVSFGELRDDLTPESSTDTTPDVELEIQEEQLYKDLWTIPTENPTVSAKYMTWSAFQDHTHNGTPICYLSEAGSAVFDAALDEKSELPSIADKGSVVDSNSYAGSLLALGLGRSSILFSWNNEKQAFDATLRSMRTSGCTAESIGSATAIFMNCGNTTRALQLFVDSTYAQNKSPGRIALAEAVSTVLKTVQAHLDIPVSSIRSILKLQALFKPVESLLTSFHAIVQSVALTRSDEAMLSQFYEEIHRLEDRSDSFREVLLEVLSRASRPFLDFAGEWMGLQREAGFAIEKNGVGKSFVKVEERSWIDDQGMEMHEPDFVLDDTMLPSFIANDDARVLFETGRSLRFLRAHHSDHPLVRADVVSSADPPPLEWHFSWEDVKNLELKALRYEKDLTAAIKQYSNPSGYSSLLEYPPRHESLSVQQLNFFGKPAEEMKAHFLESMATLSQPLQGITDVDQLSMLLGKSLNKEGDEVKDQSFMLTPPLSLTPYLSFGPIIAAQARIVNGTTMRLFFKSHHLREHLSIQRRFHLLGDGVFSSRLSHALFDPELESAERQAGVARTGGIMGLRLGGRDTWPPASSELRLALMGVLMESYVSGNPGKPMQRGAYLDRKSELPGDFSFAVRDMSESEIEKCMDPNSIEALDFLRLSYKPPPPLEAVITPLCLYKYDQLFKLLLRVTRMLYVVSQLFRDATDRTSYWQGIDAAAQRFRIEAHHFITCISSYFFDTGIDTTWRIFERKLDQIEARINTDIDLVTLGQKEGIDKLREYHEHVLNRIMFALLLRKRQQPVMRLLEEIFALILQFSKNSRSRALGITRKIGPDAEVREMYLRFRRKVEVFITVCRGMSEKKGYEEEKRSGEGSSGGLFDSAELEEGNTVVQLLARLEMSNYYSQPVKL